MMTDVREIIPGQDNRPAVILFSHGSLLCGAWESLRAHESRLRETGNYSTVEVGYLNYSKPSFEEAVARCVAAGATEIIVVPYFLVAGKFVQHDLPPRIEAAKVSNPGIEFRIGNAVLFAPEMADAIIDMAARARPPEKWRDDILNAAKYCEERETCQLFDTPYCPMFMSETCDLKKAI